MSPDAVPEGAIRRARTSGGDRWVVRRDGVDHLVEGGLADLLALPLEEARVRVDAARPVDHRFAVVAPVDLQEVWAAGVTYERSRDERMAESTEASIYDRVYAAERPELFFKAPAGRVVGPGEPVGIRVDSAWDVPEPELGLVFTSRGELFGYVPGNDMSSRSIEGENPLYLPQAKVYEAACALGPAIVPVWAVEGPFDIRLEIERDDAIVFEGTTSTSSITRTAEDLGAWLFASMPFPQGAILLTGTGIVPPESFTLAAGDVVRVTVDRVGVLENPVREVGVDLRGRATGGQR
ncbi:fumarylacetoacetate hydrolase family protein [Amnibacterium kyonggiense]|uniref:2-dehydro-3-deoxy-D-arabinonate dehydratase n=1 Tax=Amnibacterium kyonggiense TaxID=595671 RepID=A0A4V3EAZ4_9MICO|nr:fumarylacetoacetate hydrolase family protein [Amnibacterium kyonggiense]TDS79704.1 2-dehydro-3-deoxy-D-arabinonate dehydratase [Amnibacterium kyonggiense]